MNTGGYEDERAFQAHVTAQEILSQMNPSAVSGASSSRYYMYISVVRPVCTTIVWQLPHLALQTATFIFPPQNTYKDLPKAWDEAVKHFSYKHSMADLLLLSWVRSAVLILHYWVIMSKLQITVIVTTVASAYVFVKLILFDKVDNNTFETYSLLLASFVLCWTEVWLFETKVLKVENQVTRNLRPRYNSETTPLLSGGVYTGTGPESVFNYSAFQTPSATIPPTPGEIGNAVPPTLRAR
eukprot:sb/3469102/